MGMGLVLSKIAQMLGGPAGVRTMTAAPDGAGTFLRRGLIQGRGAAPGY